MIKLKFPPLKIKFLILRIARCNVKENYIMSSDFFYVKNGVIKNALLIDIILKIPKK